MPVSCDTCLGNSVDSLGLSVAYYRGKPIEDTTMYYAVLTFCSTLSGKKLMPSLVTEDIKEAKRYAKEARQKLEKKGYYAWARHIKILSPKTPEGYRELAAQILEIGHELDDHTNGCSIYGQNMISLGNRFRRIARELESES